MDESSEILASQAQEGNETAATELVERFYRQIYAYLRRYTTNDEDAYDLTQKAFSDAWRSLSKFKKQSQFSTWLYKIAHCTYVDWVRQHTRRNQRESRWWELNHQTEATPFQEFEDQEQAQRIYDIVNNLNDNYRRPIHLHYYEHLTLSQTADILEVSVGTVKNRLRDAIESIKEQTQSEPHNQQSHSKTHSRT